MEKVDSATYKLPLFDGYPAKDRLTDGELSITKYNVEGKKPSLTVRHTVDSETVSQHDFVVTDEVEKVCTHRTSRKRDLSISIVQAVYIFGYKVDELYNRANRMGTDIQTLRMFREKAIDLRSKIDDPLLTCVLNHFDSRLATIDDFVSRRYLADDEAWSEAVTEATKSLTEGKGKHADIPMHLLLNEIEEHLPELEERDSLPEVTRNEDAEAPNFYSHVDSENRFSEFELIPPFDTDTSDSGVGSDTMFVRTELRNVRGELKIYTTMFAQETVGRYTFNIVGDADNRVCVYERMMERDRPPADITWYLRNVLDFEVTNTKVVSEDDSIQKQFSTMCVILDEMKGFYDDLDVPPMLFSQAANWAGDVSIVLVLREVIGDDHYTQSQERIASEIGALSSREDISDIHDADAVRKIVNIMFMMAPGGKLRELAQKMSDTAPAEVNRRVNKMMEEQKS